jgi:hypothetical protein
MSNRKDLARVNVLGADALIFVKEIRKDVVERLFGGSTFRGLCRASITSVKRPQAGSSRRDYTSTRTRGDWHAVLSLNFVGGEGQAKHDSQRQNRMMPIFSAKAFHFSGSTSVSFGCS